MTLEANIKLCDKAGFFLGKKLLAPKMAENMSKVDTFKAIEKNYLYLVCNGSLYYLLYSSANPRSE